MIFNRCAQDLLSHVGTIVSQIQPGINAFASGILPSTGGVPLRCWFFSEGQSRNREANNRNGIWQVEIQILLRGNRNKRRQSDTDVNALAEELYNLPGFIGESGARYACLRPSSFSPRPIDLGTDDTDSELSSHNIEIWQLY